MSLIDFFGKKIKPLKLRGRGIFNTNPTAQINENIYSIAQWDVNFYVYRKGEDVILIDSGYDNYPSPERDFAKIGLVPDLVKAVFLTHADMDHAGSIVDCHNLFENATVYLHEREQDMLLGREKRFKKGPFGLRNPVKRTSGYKLLQDNEVVEIGDIKVRIIHVPGHTYGHSVYIVDDRALFTGDSMAINDEGGHCFFNFYNMDTKLNIQSLSRLKEICKDYKIDTICTGHSGVWHDLEHVFRKIDMVAVGTKEKPFDPTAPRDIFAKHMNI
ncbi:MAG: MBL fold metallo-hydrolase [Eubacteriales bacterium]|nr:MBL fold metallo-hydrolase [Eubacteriales bacterium]